MTFILSAIPGFADLADTALVHDQPALGLLLGRISSNAAFGMVRLEVFQAWYKNGDTVALPISPADGYQYSRDELNYCWGSHSTGNAASGWASNGPPWTVWYLAFNVDQATGLVTTAVGYRGNDDHKDRQANTTDGYLKVWTIAQRQRTSLVMSATPYFAAHPSTDFATDKALTQQLLDDMNNSAKAGIAFTEVIYLGEYSNGDTCAAPISPIDGYAYQPGQVALMTSLRWTMDDNAATPPVATPPAMSKGQLKGWATSVNSTTYLVTTQVQYDLSGETDYGTGRVAVFAFCSRTGNTVVVPGQACPWRDSTKQFSGMWIGGIGPITVPVIAGATYRVQFVSGLWGQGPVPNLTSAGDSGSPIAPGTPSGTGPPSLYCTGLTVNSGAMLGAWVDGAGVVVGTPFVVGLDSGTLTAPTGATRLSLGMNDTTSFGDNSGSVVMTVTASAAVISAVADSFSEIPDSTFYPGDPLKASTMLQVEKNIEEAYCSPEFFTSTHAHGTTVALPTSPLDGYTYARGELTYIWDFVDTGPYAGDNHNRMVVEQVGVDPTTGVVTINSFETSSSSDGWFENHDGTLRVITMACRSAEVITATGPTVTPVPITGAGPDASVGEWTVNGV